MNLQKKLLAVIIVVIIVVAAVAAIQLSTTPTPSTEARNIKIGVVAGMQTVEGQDIERAARMAIDEINAQGGVQVDEWNTKVNTRNGFGRYR